MLQLCACTCTFEDLVLPLRPDLLNFARRLVGKTFPSLAEDIIQDVLVKAYKAWHRFHPITDPHQETKTWLYRLVYNQFCKDYKKVMVRKRHAEERPADVHMVSHSQPTEDEGEGGFSDEVSRAMERLLPEHRDILYRAYVLGQDHNQIAADLGIAPGTVYSRLSRARTRLGPMLLEYAKTNYGFERRPVSSKGMTVAGGPPKRMARGSIPELSAIVDSTLFESIQSPQPDTDAIDAVMTRDDVEALTGIETIPYHLASDG